MHIVAMGHAGLLGILV